MRCVDLPAKSFLKTGARYQLLGGNTAPELMYDHPAILKESNNITRFVLEDTSPLKTLLCNADANGDCQYQLVVELENDLECYGEECLVDTVRVVKAGKAYFEFIERPCVQVSK